jgi:hypothetical protein
MCGGRRREIWTRDYFLEGETQLGSQRAHNI